MIGMVAALLVLASPVDTVPADPCASTPAGASPKAFVAVAPARARDTVMTASVCVLPGAAAAAKIGSYHGELRFDSTRARVLRVAKPAGGVRVENTGVSGVVKFAGAEPTGFAPGQLLSIVFRVRTPGPPPALQLKMIELNGTDGTSLLKHLVTSNRAP
jgi:hypothetical protein